MADLAIQIPSSDIDIPDDCSATSPLFVPDSSDSPTLSTLDLLASVAGVPDTISPPPGQNPSGSARRRARKDDELSEWAPASKQKLTEFAQSISELSNLNAQEQTTLLDSAVVSLADSLTCRI